MCGIAGIFHLGDLPPIQRATLAAMGRALHHRGPDAEGFHLEPTVGLCNRRLRIIDVAGVDQPLYNEDRSIAIVYNGEVYNYRELRRLVLERGHRLGTDGDTEVIVHLYEEFGIEGCLQRLRGMFAFAIWDRTRGTLWLARDRLGIKPLYVADLGDRILFGSELKALLATGDLPTRLDARALLDALVLQYVPGDKSIYRAATKLPPGSYLEVTRAGRRQVKRYWQLAFTPDDQRPLAVIAEELWERLRESVSLRLVAEVPLGAFLSGGVDSACVVAAMASLRDDPVLAVTIGFADRDLDETPYAEQVARVLRVQHEKQQVTPDDAALLGAIARTFDEPFFDSSALPTYLLARATREHVTVALSGDGGDELFGGYRRYVFDVLENRVRAWLPAPLRRGMLAPLARAWPKGDFLPRPLRFKTLLGNLARDPFEAYFHSVSRMTVTAARALLHPDLRAETAQYDPRDRYREIYANAPAYDALSRAQYLDCMTWLPDDILVKLDRASMAHSLEARDPLLDHELCEFAARIPSRHKLHGRQTKIVLKAAAAVLAAACRRVPAQASASICRWPAGSAAACSRSCRVAGECAELPRRRACRTPQSEHASGLHDRSDLLWMATLLGQFVQQLKQAPPRPPSRRRSYDAHPGAAAGRARAGVHDAVPQRQRAASWHFCARAPASRDARPSGARLRGSRRCRTFPGCRARPVAAGNDPAARDDRWPWRCTTRAIW
ncbi:MAG: asparagine synthase (glutamine-hydrolyzing) [Planctomycetota bacterium]